MSNDVLDAAHAIRSERYSESAVVFAAGSLVRGEGTAYSDLDLVVVYSSLAPDNRLMAVTVTKTGSTLETGPPRALFTLKTTSSYEPSPDGQRFLVTAVVSEASPITVILNWKPPTR